MFSNHLLIFFELTRYVIAIKALISQHTPLDPDPPRANGDSGNDAAGGNEDEDGDGDVAGPRVDAHVRLAKKPCA